MVKKENIEPAAEVAKVYTAEDLPALIEDLASSSRRARQTASSLISQNFWQKPELLVPYVPQFIEALELPEAHTRWDCLDILSAVTLLNPDICEAAVPGADSALFDDAAGPLRLAAVRFLCDLGLTSPAHSALVWPYLDDAIQCYHGDPEFQDMLIALIKFSSSDLDESVRAAFKERMSFDAQFNKGSIQARALHILDNLSK